MTATDTKNQLIEKGMALLLKHGYNDLGLTALLETTDIPKGSFYHHFETKQDFALQVIDRYVREAHAGLELCLGDRDLPPLERIRRFFTLSEEKYRDEGYLGCLMGGLGQELSGASEVFRLKIEECFAEISRRISGCFEEAIECGDVPKILNPKKMANILVNCWEGAALRSRLRKDPTPLREMLDFYFGSLVSAAKTNRKRD